MSALVVDVESRGLIPELGQTAFMVGAADPDAADCRVTLYDLVNRTDVELLLSRIRGAQVIVGHNVKFDARQLIRTLGLPVDFFAAHTFVDTLIWSAALLPHRRFQGGLGLKVLTAGMDSGLLPHADLKKHQRAAFKAPRGSSPEVKEEMAAKRHDYSLLPRSILEPYLANDILRTVGLYQTLRRIEPGAALGTKAQIGVESALLPYVLGMELKGIPLSAVNLASAKVAMEAQLAELRKNLPFDFLSRKALLEHFGDLLVRFKFETPAGMPSADKVALKFLASRDVAYADQVIQARFYHKMLTTYLRSWERFVPLGRIHSMFNITGARTGRMSSDNPNLQNIPKGLMRRVLIPEPGQVLLLGDYSQMEFRGAAYMSKDAALSTATEEDVHTAVAQVLFDVLVPDKMQRQVGKTFNYAVLYGARPRKIRSMLNQDTSKTWGLRECEALYEKYWETYPGFATWAKSIERFARNKIPITDPLGRRQMVDPVYPYKLTNYLIQGFCAGIAKRGLLAAFKAGLDCRLQVHDEIGVMTPEKDLPEAAQTLRACMSDVQGFKFPVDLAACYTNWGEPAKL